MVWKIEGTLFCDQDGCMETFSVLAGYQADAVQDLSHFVPPGWAKTTQGFLSPQCFQILPPKPEIPI